MFFVEEKKKKKVSTYDHINWLISEYLHSMGTWRSMAPFLDKSY